MFAMSKWGLGILLVAVVLSILSFCKDKRLELVYQVGCALVSFGGIIGAFISRELLIYDLMVMSNNNEMVNDGFAQWAIAAFDRFALMALVLVVLGILLSYYVLRFKPSFVPAVLKQPGRVVLALQVLIFVLSTTYGVNTINKLFDVATYIGAFAISSIGILCAGYVLERKYQK